MPSSSKLEKLEKVEGEELFLEEVDAGFVCCCCASLDTLAFGRPKPAGLAVVVAGSEGGPVDAVAGWRGRRAEEGNAAEMEGKGGWRGRRGARCEGEMAFDDAGPVLAWEGLLGDERLGDVATPSLD